MLLPGLCHWTLDVRHGEWSGLGSRDIDHRTRGARVSERAAIESIRPLANWALSVLPLFFQLSVFSPEWLRGRLRFARRLFSISVVSVSAFLMWEAPRCGDCLCRWGETLSSRRILLGSSRAVALRVLHPSNDNEYPFPLRSGQVWSGSSPLPCQQD
jgi:hypothetical protein